MNPDLIHAQITALRLAHPELVEDEDGWLLSLESETDLTDALRSIERKRHEAAALAGGIETAVAQLHERQERFERREKAMRELMFKLLQAADLRKKELPEATLSIRPGTPRVLITEEHDLPPEYLRVRPEPDKSKIKEALQRGAFVSGAMLSNAEPCLSIRVR